MNKIITSFISFMLAALGLIGMLVTAAWSLDTKYAQREAVRQELSKKADKRELNQNYRVILENELDDVSYELFRLEMFSTLTEVQQFRRKQLLERTDKLSKILDSVKD